MLPMKNEPGPETDLQKRMALHTEGQITWPQLGSTKTCADCGHFGNVQKGKGRCALVRKHHRVFGKPFVGKSATACSLIVTFEAST